MRLPRNDGGWLGLQAAHEQAVAASMLLMITPSQQCS